MEPDNVSFFDQFRALASEASWKIIGVLAAHKPEPVPVRVLSEELGYKQATTSTHLRRLRNARLVRQQGWHEGYLADTAQIKAVIGQESYTRITQELRGQNEDRPGQS